MTFARSRFKPQETDRLAMGSRWKSRFSIDGKIRAIEIFEAHQ